MQIRYLLLCLTLATASLVVAQRTGTLSGTVLDKQSQETLIGASIRLEGTDLGTTTDLDGKFSLGNIPPKTYNIIVTYVGYAAATRYNVVITSGNVVQINFDLEPDVTSLGEVVVEENRSIKVTSSESPLSIQSLTSDEIKSNPGGNFDISRVLQALPGVGGAPGGSGARNDLIIRGGGPSENVYYLDGMEIPVINHFTTQGAAGGPTGILNVSFIEDAVLSSSAFNAKYDNALSAVLQFKQREGNAQKLQGNVRLSSSELALTAEGPLSKNGKTTFLASARRSYLQLLFELIDLPIRPNYWDFQYKVTHKINKNYTLTFLGMGAIDEFSFAAPDEASPEKLYILGATPVINQWNYTTGVSLKKLVNKGYWNLTLSRNMFSNQLDQFEDNFSGNQQDESKRVLDLRSREIENKLRWEVNKFTGDWKWSYGLVGQYVKYSNSTFNRVRPEIRDSLGNLVQNAITIRYNTNLEFFRYGAFLQVSRNFMDDKLGVSAGLRTDGNSFTSTGNELWRTLSPRVSMSYAFADRWKFNASVGRYYRMAPYTVLGFRDESGFLVNKNTAYLRSDHFVGGFEFLPNKTLRITLEGFYKKYADYPVSQLTGVSLANQGTDFGIIGNERVVSNGTGEAYGTELFIQQKLKRNLFYVISYTLFWSRFANADGKLISSSWDNRHLLSVTLGRKFKNNWEIGLKYRLQGGSPFTPFDLDASRLNYVVVGRGIPDATRINQERLGVFSQLDFRIDKKWNFKKTTFDLYFDVTNALVQPAPQPSNYTFKRNASNTGFETTDGQPLKANGSNAIPILLENNDATAVPTIGFIFEF